MGRHGQFGRFKAASLVSAESPGKNLGGETRDSRFIPSPFPAWSYAAIAEKKTFFRVTDGEFSGDYP